MSCIGTAHRVWGPAGSTVTDHAIEADIHDSYDINDYERENRKKTILEYGYWHTHPGRDDSSFSTKDARLLGSHSSTLTDGEMVPDPGFQIALMRNCKCTRALVILRGFSPDKVRWPTTPDFYRPDEQQQKIDDYDAKLGELSGSYGYCFYKSCASSQQTLTHVGGRGE